MTYSNHLPDGHPQEQEQLGGSFGFFFMASLPVQQPQDPVEQEPMEQEPPRLSFFSELTEKPPLLLPPPQPQDDFTKSILMEPVMSNIASSTRKVTPLSSKTLSEVFLSSSPRLRLVPEQLLCKTTRMAELMLFFSIYSLRFSIADSVT
jgi:hypothetical protein